mmetsp:Transcript_75890/g.226243  ORF Transcript_75890/g.226243 Transcript_75890/m.226243 type:complete len:228 (-) Transcript_75890:12-695(-)
MGRSGMQVAFAAVQCAGGVGELPLGMPMTATLPGSKRIVATQEDRLSWKLAQELLQSLPLCRSAAIPPCASEVFLVPFARPASFAGAVPFLGAVRFAGGVRTGHTPQTSRQSAGFHAARTAALSPWGCAPARMHANQFRHQPWIFGLPSASFPRAHSTVVGSYAVRSGVSRTGFSSSLSCSDRPERWRAAPTGRLSDASAKSARSGCHRKARGVMGPSARWAQLQCD